MGKKQHQKDKLYLTRAEIREEAGEKKEKTNDILPFYCCCLSFLPFQESVCTNDGYVFDVKNIIPYIQKYHINPCTGQPLDEKDLVHLHWYKNTKGDYHCPVTFKVFNQSTTIVTIRTSGNVYCYEAIKELNIRAKNWTDLMTGEPFTKNDIIYIQNPAIENFRNTTHFYHVVSQENVKPTISIKLDPKMKNTIDTIRKTVEEERKAEEKKRLEYIKNRPKSQFTTNETSGSITSTSVTPKNIQEYDVVSDEELYQIKFRKVRLLKKKAYIRMVTNIGTLNCEIHCDLVPRTSYNFIELCKKGYYNNVIFHRLIKNFMIQGGDPTGTGTGGKSIFGESFKDEFYPLLQHKGPGIMSMANSGKDTNNSQFFITFADCQHLDNKHSIFGRIVGGLNVLKEMEKVPTDKNDKPIHQLIIEKTEVLKNPFDEVDAEIAEEVKLENEKLEQMKKAQQQKHLNYIQKKNQEKTYNALNTMPVLNPIASMIPVTVSKEEPKKMVTPHKTTGSLFTTTKPLIGKYINDKNMNTKKVKTNTKAEDMSLFMQSNEQYTRNNEKKQNVESTFDFSDW